jgi:tetratricopeptide (TPR) repeat protein
MYRKIFWALLALLLVTHAAAADDRELFDEAQRRFDAGAYTLALEQFQSLLDQYPGSGYATRAQLRIAQSYFYLGDHSRALEVLQRAAVRARGGGALGQEIRLWIGLSRFQLGQYDEAVADFTRYIDSGATQTARAFLYRGMSRLETGDTSGSMSDLENAVTDLEGAERGYALATLFSLMNRAGLHDRVLSLYQQESASNIDSAYREQILRLAADAAFEEGELETAGQLYRELTDFSSGSAQWAYQQLYRMAVLRNDRSEMDDLFRAAERRLSAEPERLSSFWLALGSEAVESERYELAEFYLSRLWNIREQQSVSGTVPLLLARSLEAQGRPEEALEILTSSLRDGDVRSDDGAARYLEATRLLLRLGRPEEAATMISSYPGYREDGATLYAWSHASFRSGNYDEVLQALQQPETQAFAREVPGLTRILGRVLLEVDNPREAVRAYRTYLAARPADLSARIELIRGLVSAEQFDAALQEIRRLDRDDLTRRQRNEVAYLEGLSHFQGRRYEDALASFENVTDNAYEPMLSYHVSWSLYRTGETAEAGRRIAATRTALPDDVYVDGSYLYAWTLYQQQRPSQAVDVLLPLLGSDPDNPRRPAIRELLAASYLAAGDDQEALREYRKIVEEADSADRPVYWSRYASVLASLGRDDEAVVEYDEIALRFPDTVQGGEALLEAGQILFTAGRYVQGRDRFRDYRNRYPDGLSYDRALYWGGQSSLELDEGERALLWWEPLILEYPRSSFTPRALFQSAEIHAERNRTREALELYDRYVAAYPEGPDVERAERRRQALRLAQAGLTEREAALWTELDPDAGEGPPPGSDRWFELVLELGQVAIREQITLSFQRTRIVPELQRAGSFSGEPAARANILLAEYYQRRGETRRAIESYIAAASTEGATDELRGQSLFRLAEVAHEEGDSRTVEEAVRQLRSQFPDTIWADQVERFLGGVQ